MKNYSGVRIEYHILQTFPVTCLNRDDVNSPKTAFIGGAERGRVSSQCWKRQVRLALRDQNVHIAYRTKKINDLIINNLKGDVSEEKGAFVGKIAELLSKDTLFFMSAGEAAALADYVEQIEDYEAAAKAKSFDKDVIAIMKKARKRNGRDLDGLDIALFGRMVATATDLDVQAAASFSHAITTHRVSSSVDFFTAVDDLTPEDQSGAGHVGSLEYSSGTYYRYISLDLGLLASALEDDSAVMKAVSAFTKALYSAVPAARQTTLAGYCPWNYARIFVRKGQGTQLAFDKPVRSEGEGYLIPSIKAMNEGLDTLKSLMGSMFGEIASITYGKDPSYSIDSVVDDLGKAINMLPEA